MFKFICFSVFLFLTIFSGFSAPAKASTSPIDLEKVQLDFHTIVKVRLAGLIVDSSDSDHKGTSIPWIQNLHFYASRDLSIRRNFSSGAEISTWAEKELCPEAQEITLMPLHEQQAQGMSPLPSKLKPHSITVSGISLKKSAQSGAQGTPYSQTIYCSP